MEPLDGRTGDRRFEVFLNGRTEDGRMDGRTGDRRFEVDVPTVKNLKMSPKGHTDLKI